MSLAEAAFRLQDSQNQTKATKELGRKIKLPLNSKLTDSNTLSALTMGSFLNNDSAVPQLKSELKEQLEALKSGNYECLEEMLLNQAITLNSAFNKLLVQGNSTLANSSVMKTFPHLPESLIKLALKCQNQSKQTISALVDIKNPKKPTQFIKNYVDKQVNQLKVETEGSIEELKQVGEATNAQVDIPSQSQASRVDKEVEALGG